MSRHIQEQALGQFEQIKQQVLTYALSEQIPSTPIYKHRKKQTHKFQQKHRLELLSLDKNSKEKQFDFKEANKNIRKIESNIGKIIPIGSVTFKSNFECGNIGTVKQVASNSYEITLENQTNSNRQSSWFFFSVEGIKGEAHFIIQGFTKSSSLFNEGMKVCFRDVKEQSKWRRGGTRIAYTNSVQQEDYKNSYQLRFSHFFKSNQHTCIEFAYCFPYGLKKLYNMINNIKQHVIVQTLCKSYNGLDIPLLTIGNHNSDQVIVLSARVHPGETVSSFIMEGFIKELVGDNQFGRMLLSKYLFKIVPMINPDGVIKGNYRFSGYGCDLNRKWKVCKQTNQPEIFYLRQLIKSINKDRKVIMYIDMHGHSRKKNVFFYGCCQNGESVNPNPKPKQFPYLMEKIFDAYKYENCCFNIQKDKEGTARITVWKQLKIDYIYTLQSSFCGPQFGVNYLQNDYEKIGRKLCEGVAILFYDGLEQGKSNVHIKTFEKMNMMKSKAYEELIQSPQLLHVGDVDDSGSQSQPQIGQIPQKQRFAENGLPKPQSLIRSIKKQQKTKKIAYSSKFLSQSSIKQEKQSKLKSQMAQQFHSNPKVKQNKIEKQPSLQSSIIRIQDNRQFDKVQIKIANTLNTFQLQSLRASALYQKNVRVHSLTRNNQRFSQRSKRISNPFIEQVEEKQERIKVNLMHGRQGVQYRRVRKMAEQNLKKQPFCTEESNNIVKQLQGNQIQMQKTNKNKVTIAPRFYPLSQQRNRRPSADSCIKRLKYNSQFKKFSINGDEFNVRCLGKHIYI